MSDAAAKTWNKILCENPRCRAVLALSDSLSVIVGNCLITQPNIAVVCPNCRKVKRFSSPTTAKSVRYLPEKEIAKMMNA